MEISTKRTFVPITLKINSNIELANILGALIAYGTASPYAEGGLKAIGIGEFYSGNVRKAARDLASQITTAAGIGSPADLFESYINSDKFSSSRPSKAGSAALGTNEDLSDGREESHFEDGAEADDNILEVEGDEWEPEGQFN
jgi:hypothetical protein